MLVMQLQTIAGNDVEDNMAVNYMLLALMERSENIFSSINKLSLTIERYHFPESKKISYQQANKTQTPQHDYILA